MGLTSFLSGINLNLINRFRELKQFEMLRRKGRPMDPIRKKILVWIGLTCMWSLIATGQVLAHAGHKHDAGDPSITLPAVVAQVNGVDIPISAVWNQLKQALKRHVSQGHKLTMAQEKAEAKKLIEDAISQELLSQKGKMLGIQVTPEMIDEKIRVTKTRFRSEKQFQKRLASMELTLEQYKEELKPKLLIDALVSREISPQVKIDPSKVKEYYENNKKLFWHEEQRRASVILIKIDRNQGPKADQMAKEKIQSLSRRATEGADFNELARKNSQDSLAEKGGDLGFFNRKRMLKAFSEKAFNMKLGELSEAFETKHGFHLLKVTGIRPEGYKPFDAVKGKIEKSLKKRETSEQTKAYVKALKKKASVKLYF